MLPTNVIPTTTNVQPKHYATTPLEHNIMPAKTSARSPGTITSQPKQRRRRSLPNNKHNQCYNRCVKLTRTPNEKTEKSNKEK
jgi:hypothetical protein